ncbi:type IV pilus secretin PilQ family protein [Thalassotalea euphylliae]|uniref:Type IV pilus secretin PilQ family protein n=1 Tax=Thalassotalea euphylliae TaxID=1655234 RepID=A0A3E0TVJ9_9GAMM|nr:type IV pilus secretin PilQ family protein [Thalassotalea euphylliae]REL28499.1 type IV pilus secretin PilQ family protein [Thalassotalea euphylliae]
MLFNTTIINKVFAVAQRIKIVIAMCFYLLCSTATHASDLIGIAYNTIHNDQIEVVFSFSEEILGQPPVKTSVNPATIEVNFGSPTFDDDYAETIVDHAGVETIDISRVDGDMVATINLDKLSVFDVAIEGDQYAITVTYGKAAEVVERVAPAGEEFINKVQAIDFRRGETQGEGQVIIELGDSVVAADVSDQLGKVVVEFYNTQIFEDMLYKLDVTDFATIVTGIETFREGRNAKLAIEVDGNFTFEHDQQENVFIVNVRKQEKPVGYLGAEEDFSGRTIALNFQDISVRTVLQIIADYNEFNLITSDTVTGNITLRLDGVPWDQALDIILKVKGLDKRMQGNILMVAPSDELAAREAKNLQAQQQVEELAPLYSEYLQINYAKASELAGLIKNKENSILSLRGTVSVDERTNTLLVRDTAKSIEDIKRMIDILDIPVRQVVIEARMVTVTDDINEQLGIRWGVTDTDGEYSTAGSLTGANSAGNGVTPDIADRLNVNLPVGNPAGSIAFQIARLADGTILDLELSALEQENKGEIIASPRITTANQKEAFIEQGVEIPYQEAASSGATSTQFKKAVLSLTVTPQITPDDNIILDLGVTQDTVSDITAGQAPAIDTQRIGTQVLVKNGETIVLGGVYQQSIISAVSKVPVLGDIPYFGWMFRNTNNFNEKKELLIFVTPRIVTEHF